VRHFVLAVAVACCAWLPATASGQIPFGGPAANAAGQAPGMPGQQPTSTASSSDGSHVLARIDGQVVLACEVLWEVNKLIETQPQPIPPDQLEAARKFLLQRQLAMSLDRKLLYADFLRNSGIPPQNLANLDESLRKPFEEQELPRLMELLGVKNEADLQRELLRLGSSLADARQTFQERAVATSWLQSKVKIDEKISPDEMLEYYRAHLAEYEFPAQARWEELMVRRDRFGDPARAYAELANMANEVWRWAEAQPGGLKGPAFAEMAKARSDGFTAQEGGLHDWTTKGALKAAAIDEALFTLQVGQMSRILDSELGFHIVRVLERKEAGRRPFTEVQGEIQEKLKEARFDAGVAQYIERLRQNARIWTAEAGNVSADVLLGRAQGQTQTR
jgi:hypothetical protein